MFKNYILNKFTETSQSRYSPGILRKMPIFGAKKSTYINITQCLCVRFLLRTPISSVSDQENIPLSFIQIEVPLDGGI